MSGDRVLHGLLVACAAIVGGTALCGLLTLLVGGLLAPAGGEVPGLVLSLVGSVEIVLVALLVAAPLAVAAGVFLDEHGSGPPVAALRALLRDLDQVPPLVHGVFGYAVFVELLELGPSALAAGLTLALLVLPGIVEATEDAVRKVPAYEREAALALGASRFQVITRVVLPGAARGIAGGTLRAAARALGEAGPLIVVGAVLSAPGRTGAPIGAFSAVPWRLWALAGSGTREPFGLALALTAVVVPLSVAALRLQRGGQR
jgi:phosphate transport system permease protein